MLHLHKTRVTVDRLVKLVKKLVKNWSALSIHASEDADTIGVDLVLVALHS